MSATEKRVSFCNTGSELFAVRDHVKDNQLTEAIHFHTTDALCNQNCTYYVDGKQTSKNEFYTKTFGSEEFGWRKKVFGPLSDKDHIKARTDSKDGIAVEAHAHAAGEVCNLECNLYISGFTATAGPNVGHPHTYPVDEYMNALHAEYLKRTRKTEARTPPQIPEEQRQEHAMIASYSVDKLKSALAARKEELEADLTDRKEWTLEAVKEFFEKNEDEEYPNDLDLSAHLTDGWNRGPGRVNADAKRMLRHVNKAIAQLDLVSSDSVELSDSEYQNLGL